MATGMATVTTSKSWVQMRFYCVRAFAVALASACSVTVVAQENSGELETYVGIEAGYGQSDNLTREQDGGAGSGFGSVGLDFDLASERRRFSGELGGTLRLRSYRAEGVVTDEEDDELVGSLDGSSVVDLVTDRFAWSFSGSSGQARTNPRGVSNPRNRERVRVFSTGPRLQLPVGDRTSIEVTGSVSERGYEESETFDSRLSRVNFGVYRSLTSVSQVGLELARTDVDYDVGFREYEFESANLSYEREFATGSVAMRLGSGKVRSAGQDSGSRPFVSMSWSRDVGARSALSLWARRELTDPGSVFSSGGSGGNQDSLSDLLGGQDGGGRLNDARLRDVVLGADAVERSSAGVTLSLDGRRTGMSFSAGASEDDFEGDEAFNNEGWFAEVQLSREFNPVWQGTVRLRAIEQEFVLVSDSNEDFLGEATLTRDIGRRTRIELRLERNSRSSGPGTSDEDVYLVSFHHALIQ